MSRSALILALLTLSACGFKPLHSQEERAKRDIQVESVQVITDGTRYGQLLKAEIEDQVNPDAIRAEKPFAMAITFKLTEVSLFVKPDGTASRGDMQFTSSYVLRRKLDNKIIDTGSLSRVSSYNISETADYGTYVSREDATRRGVLELAQDYKLRLANLVGKLNNPNAVPTKPEVEDAVPLIRAQDTHENRTQGF